MDEIIARIQGWVPLLAGHPVLTVIVALLAIWQAWGFLVGLALAFGGRVPRIGLLPGVVAGIILLVLYFA